MPQQNVPGIENNFTKGLVTEFTGLNFPENAATETQNCIYTLVGDVIRRPGINLEQNYQTTTGVSGGGRNSYVWSNAGGDGLTRLLARQQGATLYFYLISSAQESNPVSSQLIGSTITISNYVSQGGTFDVTQECQFSDGNGYLFVYHPNCDPFYCTYASGTITANVINVQIRDFVGVTEPGLAVNTRPASLTNEHQYNLINQGWVVGNPWSATSTSSVKVQTGVANFQVAPGISGLNPGQAVSINLVITPPFIPGEVLPVNPAMSGVVSSYDSVGGVLVIAVTSINTSDPGTFKNWSIVPLSVGFINTWFSAIGNYPSNADQWWNFKDTTDAFNPAQTIANTFIGSGQAPQGSILLSAFNQNRSASAGVSGITTVSTVSRPTNGCWFQGRVWYTGVNASFPGAGDMPYSTWTENIYFSQVVQTVSDFGQCYQLNDPTSEDLFDLLPTDGGVITIQGAGAIYKLFPIANGMIVFASNGVWFITGSQGIGFSANDYTITKISNVQSISSTSFVNVMGLPYFWNEEGIYAVQSGQGGQLSVEPLTVGTILTFYNEIPFASKKYVRGDYDPINYIIQWTYKIDQETSVSDRYRFNGVLNLNVYNKAFYPYTISNGTSSNPFINGVNYISYPQITAGTPDPGMKFIASYFNSGTFTMSIAEEFDTSYLDWNGTFGSPDYTSYFITGFRLVGQGQRRFQMPYIYTFTRGGTLTQFLINGIWDYASDGASGRFSSKQLVTNDSPYFGMIFNRHKIRGQGLVLQIQVTSVSGQPFDLMGWATFSSANTGV